MQARICALTMLAVSYLTVPRYSYRSPVRLSSTATENSGEVLSSFFSAAVSWVTCLARSVSACSSALGPLGDGLTVGVGVGDEDAAGEGESPSITELGDS